MEQNILKTIFKIVHSPHKESITKRVPVSSLLSLKEARKVYEGLPIICEDFINATLLVQYITILPVFQVPLEFSVIYCIYLYNSRGEHLVESAISIRFIPTVTVYTIKKKAAVVIPLPVLVSKTHKIHDDKFGKLLKKKKLYQIILETVIKPFLLPDSTENLWQHIPCTLDISFIAKRGPLPAQVIKWFRGCDRLAHVSHS